MNDAHKPDDFHDEKLSQLYRKSRIEEPPMALDSVIQQHARKATEKRSDWWAWLRRFWIAPLATAAVALLTVSVVIQTKQQHPEALAPAVQSEAPAAKQNEVLSEGFADREKATMEKRKAAPSTAAPAAGQTPATRALRQAPAPAAIESKVQLKKEMKAAKPVRRLDHQSQQIGTQGEAATDSVSGLVTPRTPEAWLEQIQTLLEAGKRKDARAELAKFIGHYPNRPLPPELEKLRKSMATTPEE